MYSTSSNKQYLIRLSGVFASPVAADGAASIAESKRRKYESLMDSCIFVLLE